ncbi:hypothetical protein A2U01_0046915, partial [Trifolium medium]|nr:hypothetical protein [Trifolium medium]
MNVDDEDVRLDVDLDLRTNLIPGPLSAGFLEQDGPIGHGNLFGLDLNSGRAVGQVQVRVP